MDTQIDLEPRRHLRAEATILRERFLRVSQSYNEGLQRLRLEDIPRDEPCADKTEKVN